MSFWSPFMLGVVAGGVTVWRMDRCKRRSWIKRLGSPLPPASHMNDALQTPSATSKHSAEQEEAAPSEPSNEMGDSPAAPTS